MDSWPGTAEQQAGLRPWRRAAAVRPRWAIRLPAWRASTWLLNGWTVTVGLWIVAKVMPLDVCPYGQDCDRAPALRDDAAILGWIAVWLAGMAALLLLYRRDRHAVRAATVAAARRSRWVALLPASLAGVLAGAHLLLLAPMISDPQCATPVHINRLMAYPVNCDSALFLEMAHDPGLLLTLDNQRQSRPGYIALSALATRILGRPAARLGLDRAYGQADTAYIPLILINLIVAVAAVALLARLLRSFGAPAPIVIALCSLLVLNDLMKAFFWTPHQQMFVLLIPLAAISLGRWLLLERPRWALVAALGLGLGLASLIYANVVIAAAVLAVIMLARGWLGVARALVLCATYAIAPAGWVWACHRISGSYYDQETARYHEFVWLPQALGQGWQALSARLEMASVLGIRQLLGADGIVLGVLAAVMVAAIWTGVRVAAVTPQDRALLTATGLTIALSLAFGWGIGIIATRVMFDAFPAFLVLAGWMATRFAVKSRATLLVASYGLAIVAVANALHEVLTHGPYS
jgi:hypothetical protein